MGLRFIPTRVHGVLDYAVGGLLLAAPELFRLKDVPASAMAPRLAGAGAAAYSLVTDYELSPVKLLPMPVHLALDAGSGALLSASPFLFGYARAGTRYWLPHTLVGVLEVLVAAMTQTRPSYK